MIRTLGMKPFRLLAWSLVMLSLLGLSPGGALAAGNGLRISPVRSDLTINPGQTQVVMINVTNVTTQPASFQAVVNDFTASSNQSGNPALLLGANQYAPSHSLKRFTRPIPNFTLQAGQETQIPVTISIPQNAAGGGYYGAVRFAPASISGSNSTVSLSGSVGSLILVTVPGNIIQKLSISGFDAEKNNTASTIFTSNKDIQAVVRFQNEGNVQVEPYGKILLKNSSNKILAQYQVNNISPPGNVLPNSIRKFTLPVTGLGSFGIYKLEGNFGYGSNGQLLSASTTFYVIPVALVVLFIALVIVLLLLIFGLPRLIKAYNQRVIRQASRRR